MIGSFWSSSLVERIGVARAYGAALVVMAVGFGVGAASVEHLDGRGLLRASRGIGNGVAVVCNALLVQRDAATTCAAARSRS